MNLNIGPETPETYALAGSCDRGIQKAPDLLRRAMMLSQMLESQLVKIREDHELEMQSIVMIRCTKHVRVPKLNGLAHGDAECGACIAEELANVTAERDALKRDHEDDASEICRIEDALGMRDRIVGDNGKSTLDTALDRIRDMIAKIGEQGDEIERLRKALTHLLAHCQDTECEMCAKIICPHEDPLHFHHDGCPQCDVSQEGGAP